MVPAVGRAQALGPELTSWRLEAPMRLASQNGEPLRGQIELPAIAERRGKRYLFLGQSIFRRGRWRRATRAFAAEGEGWKPVNGRGGIILGPESHVYGFGVLPDPARPGELLAHAFYDRGHARAMQPTPLIRLAWRGETPVPTFDGPCHYR